MVPPIANEDLPPIADEDLAKFGVESQLIPFIISITLRAEQSPNNSTRLTPAEAECLVEVLDKVHLSADPFPPHALNPRRSGRVIRHGEYKL